MKNRKSLYPEKLVEAFELPKDLLLGLPLMTLNGNRELIIENHRGITEYTSSQITILSKSLRIQLSGEHLVIDYYFDDIMKIRGQIKTICFLE